MSDKPLYRVAAAGLDPRDERLIEIVFKHSQYNRFEFVLVEPGDFSDIDILIVNPVQSEGLRALARLRTLGRDRPVVSAVPRGAPSSARHAISIDRLTLQLLPILNRVVEMEIESPETRPMSFELEAERAPGAERTQEAASLAVPPEPPRLTEPIAREAVEITPAADDPRPLDPGPLDPTGEARPADAPSDLEAPASPPAPAPGSVGAPAPSAPVAMSPPVQGPPTPSPPGPPGVPAAQSTPAGTRQPESLIERAVRAATGGADREPPLSFLREAVETPPRRAPVPDRPAAAMPPQPAAAAHRERASAGAQGRGVTSPPAPARESSTVASEAPGRAASEHAPAIRPPRAQPGKPGPARADADDDPRIRILVVDDSPTVRDQMVRAFGRLGTACDTVASATDAMAALALRHYDLAVVDVVMPETDGYKLTRIIRRRYRGMPVIILTTRSSPFDLARGALAGCDTYLVKPITMRRLEQALIKVLRKTLAIDDLTGLIRPLPAGAARAQRTRTPSGASR
ncbi:MAG: response regulator [Burkholderiaceae bacterium]